MSLTPKQRVALDAIKGREFIDVPTLARALDTSPEGAAQTGASLVRRGLARRVRVRGHVAYTLDGVS